MRNQYAGVQNLTEGTDPSQIWLVYSNEDHDVNYKFDCQSKDRALVSAFDAGTTVKNLFAPYEEIELGKSSIALGIGGSAEFNGCVDELNINAYYFRAYVPKANC